MNKRILVLSLLLGTLTVLGATTYLPIMPVHASPTYPVLLDANSTGGTDANPQAGLSTAKTFNVGAIIEANSTTPLNNVFAWQFTIIYDNTTVAPQGDPVSASATDGAASTVTFGAQTGTGNPNWAGKIATSQGFGGFVLHDPGIDNHHHEIQVYFTFLTGSPVSIAPVASGTVKGNLLANVAFEVIKPATNLDFSIDISNTKFTDNASPIPNVLPGIVAGPPITETITNNPSVASFTATALASGSASCTPVTGATCSAYAFSLDATASSDSDGTIADPSGYFWDFGDGIQDNVNNPGCGLLLCNQGHIAVHDYGVQGVFEATLRVIDDTGATGSARDQLGSVIVNIQPSHTSRRVAPGYDSTSTSLVCVPSPVDIGSSTTCTVTVTDTAPSGATAPTGLVTFTTNSTGAFTTSPCTLGSPTANSATCSVTYAPTTIGGHRVTANYTGDSNHDVSAGFFDFRVITHTTITSISCNTPVDVNQVSTCTASVADSTSSPTAPTGTITPTLVGSSSGTLTPSCSLSGSSSPTSCTLAFMPSSSGTADISASYSGDASHGASSTSSPFTITVNLRTTSTSISCDTPIIVTTSSTCTATVTDTSTGGTALTPTGIVTFAFTGVSGAFDQTNCALAAGSTGTATCLVHFTPTTAGTASISGTYTPSDSTVHSSSATLSSATITVNSPPAGFTTTTISCDSTVIANQASVCTATVTDVGTSPTTPLGTVGFTATGSSTGTFGSTSPCTLTAGSTSDVSTCTASFVPSQAGTASVSAIYTPSDSHTSSSSATPSSITVNLRTTTTTITCSSPVNVDTASACTITVADTATSGTATPPSGTITLTSTGSSVSGSCTLSGTGASTSCTKNYTPSTAGSDTLTASYPGDSSHSSSSGTFLLTVNYLPPTLTVTGPSTANTGASVSLTLSSSANGGTVTSIKVEWGDGLTDNLSGTSTLATHTYSTAGNYNLTITATDSHGLQTVRNQSINVTAPGPLLPGGDPTIIAIVAIIIALAAVLLLLRRRRAATPQATAKP